MGKFKMDFKIGANVSLDVVTKIPHMDCKWRPACNKSFSREHMPYISYPVITQLQREKKKESIEPPAHDTLFSFYTCLSKQVLMSWDVLHMNTSWGTIWANRKQNDCSRFCRGQKAASSPSCTEVNVREWPIRRSCVASEWMNMLCQI